MKALVLGLGSIGQRHARLLSELGHEVFSVSRHLAEDHRNFHNLEKALAATDLDYVVIASETDLHLAHLQELDRLCWRGRVLVEKPLFHKTTDWVPSPNLQVYVGYNLRFLPLLTKIKEICADLEIVSANAYVGADVLQWRQTGTGSYSFSKNRGGGVLRDLSHELDYLLWLFGPCREVVANAGHFSQLNGDSEDVAQILMATEKCKAILVEMNYLDSQPQRTLVINTTKFTIKADFISGKLQVGNETETFPIDRDESFRNMHSVIFGEPGDPRLCAFSYGHRINQVIEAVEKSVEAKKWIAV